MTSRHRLSSSGLPAILALAFALLLLTEPAAAEELDATQERISAESEIAETGHHVALSADGRFAVFAALVPPDPFNMALYLYDSTTGEASAFTSPADGEHFPITVEDYFAISADGNTIAYQAWSNPNVDPIGSPPQPTNQSRLVFLDRQSGTKQSFDASNSFRIIDLIEDGNVLVFAHQAPGPLPTFFDRRTGEFTYMEYPEPLCDGFPVALCINAPAGVTRDGRYVAYTHSMVCQDDCGGTEYLVQAYVLDRKTGEAELVSGEDVEASAVDISDDGRYVLVRETQPDDEGGICRDIVHDRQSDTDIAVDFLPDGTDVQWFSCGLPPGRLSADGNAVTLVLETEPGAPPSAFVRDIAASETRLVSIPAQDEALDIEGAWNPVPSADGSVVAFVSRAGNLVDDDGDAHLDAFRTEFSPVVAEPSHRLILPGVTRDSFGVGLTAEP